MKTRTYLILMAAAILIPVAVISWVGINMLLQSERESKLRSIEETARATVLLIEKDIAVAESSLQNVTHSQGIKVDDFERLHRLLSSAKRTPLSWSILSDYTGQPLFNTLVPFGSPLPVYTGKWASEVFESQKTRVSGVFIGELSRRPAVSVDVPVPKSVGKTYIVSQIFDTSYFNHAFERGALGKDWIIAIFDANGIAIARNKNAARFVGKPVRKEIFEASRLQSSGVVQHPTSDGIDVYGVFSRSDVSKWTVVIGVPVAEIESAARSTALYAALSVIAVLALAFSVAAFFARRLAQSMQQASVIARSLRQGAVTHRERSHVHEVDVLLAELHDTSIALKKESEARHLLQSEHEQLLRSEQEARKHAESESKAKDDFLAMLGHELRNPLAAISGALTLIDMSNVSAEAAARAREIGKRQVNHLTRIVDELLDLRRILSGKVILQLKPVNIGIMLEHCVESQSTSDAGKHQWKVSTQDIWIKGDRTRLEQIIGNLLHNAAKYTPDGGLIDAKCYQLGEDAIIEIRDTGVGISSDLLPRIFDVFVQGPTSIDRSKGGLGLGLSLVKELTALHYGVVDVASEGGSQGSTFTLRFPCISDQLSEHSLADSVPAGTNLHILIVEDNDDGREMLATVLQMQGFKVSTARDGKTALALAAKEKPDIAVVDIGLPDISGYELAQSLRADPLTKMIRLIALTGYGLEEDRTDAMRAGFSAHLTKPYTLDTLLNTLLQDELRLDL